MTLVLTTFDWVPEFARGYVRDLRIRWLLNEIGRDYSVDTVSSANRSPEHLLRQPFAQVPMVQDGDLSLFETGAILIHLAESTALLPDGPDRSRTIQWLIAALNSIEPYAFRWQEAKFFDKNEAAASVAEAPLRKRLDQLQQAMQGRDWLIEGRFTIADILMADVLRIPAEQSLLDDLPQLAAYAERATARPAFAKAYADQMAHWAEADAKQQATA